MSQADILLNSLNEDEIATYTAEPETEGHIIVGSDRFITVPEKLKRIAVQYDHNIETVTFDCPRYWDNLDMSQMKVYINYLRSDNGKGTYAAEEVTVDENNPNIMHFNWVISRNVTQVKGKIAFLVCIKRTDIDGNEEIHWNSEVYTEAYVSEGLDCESSVFSNYPDIITQLLYRMDDVEMIATPEAMQDYITEYLNGDDKLQAAVAEKVDDHLATLAPTTETAMQGYADRYFEQNPVHDNQEYLDQIDGAWMANIAGMKSDIDYLHEFVPVIDQNRTNIAKNTEEITEINTALNGIKFQVQDGKLQFCYDKEVWGSNGELD